MKKAGLLTTESRLTKSYNIDALSIVEILKLINQEDKTVPFAVQKVIPEIVRAVRLVVSAFNCAGRLIYIGAGSSGRLGICDAAECPPTFGVDPSLVQAVLAGGQGAIFKAVEGAEDKEEEAAKDLKARKFSKKDVLIGLSASGRTPYVIGALKYAAKLRAGTVVITCNKEAPVLKYAKVPIAVMVGPEVITGSTRLKAGTAEKLILNMISTVSMIKSGRTFGNYMIDLLPLSQKLKRRSRNILMNLTGLNERKCKELLKNSGGNLKAAVLMGIKGIDYSMAETFLKNSSQNLREALNKIQFK